MRSITPPSRWWRVSTVPHWGRVLNWPWPATGLWLRRPRLSAFRRPAWEFIPPSAGHKDARTIGVGFAKWLILTGKTLSATEAANIGLVDRVVDATHLDEVCRGLALGPFGSQKLKTVPNELAAVEQFFKSYRAVDLHAGTADPKGSPVLARAMRSVSVKAPIALTLAEWLIEEGSRRSLEEGLQLEIDHLGDVFSTADAYRGLMSCVRRGAW